MAQAAKVSWSPGLPLTEFLYIQVDGGATFSEDKGKNADAKMTGSWAIFKAENADKVREILENDIYATGEQFLSRGTSNHTQ